MFEDKKGKKLHVSRPSTKDVNGNISFEGCQGLPLASDEAYDKHDD